MSTDLLRFDEPVNLEVRDIEKREVAGRIVPFGETIRIRGRAESFAPGATSGIDITKTKLLLHHDPSKPVGRGLVLEERSDGAYAVFRVSKTQAGDEALELARDGLLSFSPGFITGTQTRSGAITSLAAMPEVSLVAFPAYSKAAVLSVRQQGEEQMDEPIETQEAPEVDLSEFETRMDQFASALDKIQATVSAPPARNDRLVPASLTPKNWFFALVEAQYRNKPQRLEKIEEDFAALQKRVASGEVETRDVYAELGLQTRALADITGGETQAGDNFPADDLSGLVVSEFMGDQLVNVLNTRRPVFRNMGSIRMPRSGYNEIPTITQHTLVKGRGDQKTEIPSRAMISENAAYRAEWIAGGVDIALEIIRTSSLDVLGLVWNDLLGQYARATEYDDTVGKGGNPVGIVPFIEAGGHGFTYTGTAIATDTYAAFVADVMEAAEEVEDATGAPATKLFVPRSTFRTVAGFIDGVDRRIFSMLGATNADARVSFGANEIQLPGGPTIIKAATDALTAAVLTNEEAFKVADGGPERLEALNVALAGRDLGILGRTLLVPRIPAGVVVFGSDPGSA